MSLAGVTPTHACNLASAEVQRREGELLRGIKSQSAVVLTCFGVQNFELRGERCQHVSTCVNMCQHVSTFESVETTRVNLFPARPGSCVPKLSAKALGSRHGPGCRWCRWCRWRRCRAAGDGDAANCGHAEARRPDLNRLLVLRLCLPQMMLRKVVVI